VKRTVITPPATAPKQIARLAATMFQVFGDHAVRIEKGRLR